MDDHELCIFCHDTIIIKNDLEFPHCSCTQLYRHMHSMCLLTYYEATHDSRCCFCRLHYRYHDSMLSSRDVSLQKLFCLHLMVEHDMSFCHLCLLLYKNYHICNFYCFSIVVRYWLFEKLSRLWQRFRLGMSIVFSCIFFNYFVLHFLCFFHILFSASLLLKKQYLIFFGCESIFLFFISFALIQNVHMIWELLLPEWVRFIVFIHLMMEGIIYIHVQYYRAKHGDMYLHLS